MSATTEDYSEEVQNLIRKNYSTLSSSGMVEYDSIIQDAMKFRELRNANPSLVEDIEEDMNEEIEIISDTPVEKRSTSQELDGNCNTPAAKRKKVVPKRILTAVDTSSSAAGELNNPPPPARTSKKERTPAIFVTGNVDFPKLQTMLTNINEDEFCVVARKIDDAENFKLLTTTVETFKTIRSRLQDDNVNFHTNQLEEEKPLKYVLKGIPTSVDDNFIKNELLVRDFNPTKVTRLFNRKRQPLQIFLVELPRQESNTKLLELKKIGTLKVSVENLRRGRWATQCFKCQRFNHAAVTCYNVPRCVKCGDNHLTSDCSRKNWGTEVKCANCGGSHPASFKGCPSFPKPKTSYADVVKKGPFQGQKVNKKGPFQGQGKNQKGPFKGQGKKQKGPFQGQGKNQKGPSQGQVTNPEAMSIPEIQVSSSASQTEGQYLQELQEKQDMFQERQDTFQEKQDETNQMIFSTLGDLAKGIGELSTKFGQLYSEFRDRFSEQQDRPPSRQRHTPKSQRSHW